MQSQTYRKVLSIIQRIFFIEPFENKLQICCSIILNKLVYISHKKFSKIPPNQKIIIDILLVAHYAKAFDCVDHNKLWKILKEMGIPDHLICLERNLYAGQEATVRTGHEQQTCSK